MSSCDDGDALRLKSSGKEGVIILGVIHRDEKGRELLDRWLKVIEPQVITLEFSMYGMEFRKEKGPFYKKRIEEVYNRLKKTNLPCYDNALTMVLSYVAMPYEFELAREYGRQNTAPVYLIDMDLFSFLKLRRIEEFLSEENLERQLSIGGGERAGYEQAMARLYFERGVKASPYPVEMYVRDRYMSRKIAILRRYHKGKRLLHICGWRHLEDPCGLYAPHGPKKVFIYDKALCL